MTGTVIRKEQTRNRGDTMTAQTQLTADAKLVVTRHSGRFTVHLDDNGAQHPLAVQGEDVTDAAFLWLVRSAAPHHDIPVVFEGGEPT